MKTILRKSLLYKTKVEYGDYTLNHVEGCSHGCKYPCYAMMLAKRFGKVKSYEEWIEPKLAKNSIELLKKELPKYKNKIDNVHLCFTTDPFMYGYDEICEMSLDIVRLINSYDINCSILTKGILPKELKDYDKRNVYGITLISLDEEFRKEVEPNSAPYEERINSLKYLKESGCRTWVSVEPYPTPNIIDQDLSIILDKIKFVDRIIFGRLNYNTTASSFKSAKEYFNKMTDLVIDFCNKNNIDYHIKEGTKTDLGKKK